MKKPILHTATVAILALMVSACTTPYETPKRHITIVDGGVKAPNKHHCQAGEVELNKRGQIRCKVPSK